MPRRERSAGRHRGTDTRPRFRAPLVRRHIAIIDTLLVGPFAAEPLVAGEHALLDRLRRWGRVPGLRGHGRDETECNEAAQCVLANAGHGGSPRSLWFATDGP